MQAIISKKILPLVIFLLLLTSCVSYTLRDEQTDQPLLGAHGQAQGRIVNRIYTMDSATDSLEWFDDQGRKVKTGWGVIKQCRKYLINKKIWNDMRGNIIEGGFNSEAQHPEVKK